MSVLRRNDPVLPDDQGLVQVSVQADVRDGRQLTEDGETGLDRAGLHDPVPKVEDLGRPVLPDCLADGLLNLLIDSIGIKFTGDGERRARKRGVAERP